MKIVYPLTVQIDYTELKYSLRSIEKYASFDEIIIVGEIIPDWLTNVTQLCVADVQGRKQLSIRKKILAALEYAKEFLFMNDDVYLLMRQDFTYKWHGMLKKYSESGARPLEKRLIELNKPTKLFDGHYPLIYTQEFRRVSEYYHPDCIIKSMYCNHLGIEGELTQDCKLLRPYKHDDLYQFIRDKSCFSTGVLSLQSALPILNNLFPNKSAFEV